MEGLAGMITQRMQSRHLLLIIDAPYSGSAVGGRPGLVRLNAESPGPSVTILTSTTADQTSWASVRCQNSVFTRQLIDSLRRTPQLSAAFPRVKDLVNEEVQSDHPGARQTPLLHSSGSEDLDLSVVPDAPQSGPKTESTEAPTKAKAKIETPGGTAAPR